MLNLTKWKLLLVLVTTLISIASGEIAIVVIGLILSVYVDEMRFRVLFKERREMMGVIMELHQLSHDQRDAILILEEVVRQQTSQIVALQVLNRELRSMVQLQTNRITELEETNRRLSDKVESLEKENKRQRIINILAIVVAILGILWGIMERFIR